MAEWFEYAKGVGELLTIAATVGSTVRWVMLKYLDERFATRHDLARVETKVDSLLAVTWKAGTGNKIADRIE